MQAAVVSPVEAVSYIELGPDRAKRSGLRRFWPMDWYKSQPALNEYRWRYEAEMEGFSLIVLGATHMGAKPTEYAVLDGDRVLHEGTALSVQQAKKLAERKAVELSRLIAA